MDAEHTFIKDLQANSPLDQVFLVVEKELRTTRKGDPYLLCTLADKTGRLSARMWQANEGFFQSIPVEGFLHVRGRVEDYKGTLQVIIEACRPWPKDKVNIEDYLAVTENDVEGMWAEMLELLRPVKNRHIRMLIKKFVEDRHFVESYKHSPAAMQMHHPFVGGLLEHTLGILRAAAALLPLYPKLSADLVLAGVFFHDMGKIAELHAGTSVGYTDRGQLVGHITIAAIWLQEKAANLAQETGEPFPPRTLDLLQHIILSHHGVHEYGSPKLPMIPEAYFIHYLDNLDAKMFMTFRDIEADADPTGSFTAYNRQLETRLYKHSGDLEAEFESKKAHKPRMSKADTKEDAPSGGGSGLFGQ